jgi:hypothetical protein
MNRFAPLAVLIIVACSPGQPTAEGAVTISVEHLVTLGNESGEGSFASYPIPATKTSRGWYVVADYIQAPPIPVFDSTGKYLRSFGADGDGPGEARSIVRILTMSGDSVMVVDGQLRRASVFSSDLAFVRSFVLPVTPFEIVQFGTNSFVAVPNGDRDQPPFRVFDRDGLPIAGFVAQPAADQPTPPHRISAGKSGRFWSAPWGGEYLIEEWDSLGTRLHEFRPASAWAVPYAGYEQISPEVPPQWALQGLWLDASGHVVVVAQVGDAEWAEGLGSPQMLEGRSVHPVIDTDKAYDTLIEVIDAETGVVLGSRRLDESYRMVPFAGSMATVIESETGGMRVKVMSVKVDPVR